VHTIDTTVTIGAPPAAVWRVLTDFDRYAEWNPFVHGASGRAAVGETLVLQIRPPGDRSRTHQPTVVAADPDRRLAWVGRASPAWLLCAEHELLLEQPVHGRTRLRHSERFTGLLVPFLARTLRRTALGFDELNRALKQRAEGVAPDA
jgi:hypothetical protein